MHTCLHVVMVTIMVETGVLRVVLIIAVVTTITVVRAD